MLERTLETTATITKHKDRNKKRAQKRRLGRLKRKKSKGNDSDPSIGFNAAEAFSFLKCRWDALQNQDEIRSQKKNIY